MKWNNLKQNKCPKCSKDLARHDDLHVYCGNCDFLISNKRFKEIITSQVERTIENHYRPEDENPDLI